MVMLGFLAGLRVAEIAALRWEDVALHVNPPVLVVRHGKGNKDRVVPLHPELRVHLVALERGAGPVIESWSEPGEHVQPGTITRTITGRFRAHGLAATPHALRHTFITEAFRASRSAIAARNLAGHDTIATTERYIGFTPDTAEVITKMFM